MNSSFQQEYYDTTLDDSTITITPLPAISAADLTTMCSSNTITLNNMTSSYAFTNMSTISNGISSYTIAPQTVFKDIEGNSVLEIEKATLEVTGTVQINGVDLEERLKTIETVLQIPTRDAIIESQYPKLREIYELYTAELEKYKTWNRLKKGTAK